VSPTLLENSGPAPIPATTVLGVLGGIASGKSLVARLLAGPEGVVIDADELVDAAYADAAFRERVLEHFGPRVRHKDGGIDRAALGRLVFDDPLERRRLEGWIHPLVRERIEQRMTEARAARVPRVVLDVPLLLENDAQHHLASSCSALVFVDASRAQREARARGRGWATDELARREATQLPLEEKRRRAQHVVENHGTKEQLAAAVKELRSALTLD
jgi:dephospho-CoA kinase